MLFLQLGLILLQGIQVKQYVDLLVFQIFSRNLQVRKTQLITDLVKVLAEHRSNLQLFNLFVYQFLDKRMVAHVLYVLGKLSLALCSIIAIVPVNMGCLAKVHIMGKCVTVQLVHVKVRTSQHVHQMRYHNGVLVSCIHIVYSLCHDHRPPVLRRNTGREELVQFFQVELTLTLVTGQRFRDNYLYVIHGYTVYYFFGNTQVSGLVPVCISVQ